ncbi:MAG TPA: hypothetical protein VFP35_01710 [Candidatus Saccharimonadales bacterium]|nr:hypothetical protein [Candidatus Saccharimonadales bacterium]
MSASETEPQSFGELFMQFVEEAEPEEVLDSGAGLAASVVGAVATGAGLAMASRGYEAGAIVSVFGAAEAVACLHLAIRDMRRIAARAR